MESVKKWLSERNVKKNGVYVHYSPPKLVGVVSSAQLRAWARGGAERRLERAVLAGQGRRLLAEAGARPSAHHLPALVARCEALHDAVEKGSLLELQELLEADYNRRKFVMCRDEAGVGLLHKAVYYDFMDIAEYLVKNYPQMVHMKDSEGRTPLHYAALCRDEAGAASLLEGAGGARGARDAAGRTPAAYRGVGRTLLELPAPPPDMPPEHRNPPGLVIKRHNIRIWCHDCDMSRLQRVVWEGHGARLLSEVSNQSMVKKFLEAVPYIMNTIRDIHQAVVDNDLEGLMKHSGDPVPPQALSSRDTNNMTVMHKAAGLGHGGILKYLAERYPQGINDIDNDGKTPLHYAAAMRDDQHTYNTLVSLGADESVVDNKNKTPAYYVNRPQEIDKSLFKTIPEAPRTPSSAYPSSWDWKLLDNYVITDLSKKTRKKNFRASTENISSKNNTTSISDSTDNRLMKASSTHDFIKDLPELDEGNKANNDSEHENEEEKENHNNSKETELVEEKEETEEANLQEVENELENDENTAEQSQPADGPAGEPAEESAEEPAEEPAGEPAEEPAGKPAEELAGEPAAEDNTENQHEETKAESVDTEVESNDVSSFHDVTAEPDNENERTDEKKDQSLENSNDTSKEPDENNDDNDEKDHIHDENTNHVDIKENGHGETNPLNEENESNINSALDSQEADGATENGKEDESHVDTVYSLEEHIQEKDEVVANNKNDDDTTTNEGNNNSSAIKEDDDDVQVQGDNSSEYSEYNLKSTAEASDTGSAKIGYEGNGRKTQQSLIEGIISGEAEQDSEDASITQRDESVHGEVLVVDNEIDPEVTDLINTANMEMLATLVLNGEGSRLIGRQSGNSELQGFLDNVPSYMQKINQVHVAAREGNLKDLQSALDRRKFAIARDPMSSNGATPMHVATIFGKTNIMKYLGSRFPETLSAVDFEGRSALHYAAVLPDNGHYYNLMQQLGANTKDLDDNGRSAEDYFKKPSLLPYDQLLSDFGINDEAAQSMFTDKVPEDRVSSRRNLEIPEALDTLERCYRLLASARPARTPLSASSNRATPPVVLGRFLKKSIFDVIKYRITKLDHDLFDVIWPAVKKLPDNRNLLQTVEEDFPGGITAPDYYVYAVFNDFLTPLIKDLHNMNVGSELPIHPQSDFIKTSKSKLSNEPLVELNIDPNDEFVLSGTIECSRNLQGFELPLNLKIGKLETIERIVTTILMEEKFTKLSEQPNPESDQKGGTYYTLNEVLEKPSEICAFLASNGLLIALCDRDEIDDCTRLHGRHWPYGRGVFLSDDKSVAIWINIHDHIRVLVSTAIDSPGEIGLPFSKLSYIMTYLHEKLDFVWDDKLGHLSSRPTFIGAGIRFSLIVNFPGLSKEPDNMKHLCAMRGLQYRETLSTGPTYPDNGHVDIPIFQTEEGRYLAKSLGDPLIKGLTEVANVKPKDPVAFLASFLHNFPEHEKPRMGTPQVLESKVVVAQEAEVESEQAPEPPAVQQVAKLPRSAARTATRPHRPIDVVTVDPQPVTSPDAPEIAFSSAKRDEHGQSMLHFAAARTHARNALFQLLQESDVSLGYRDELYRTARDVSTQANVPENTTEIDRFVLHLAARGETDKIMELLMAGYDHILDVVDEEGVVISDVISQRGDTEMSNMLASIPAFEESRDVLFGAVRRGDLQAVQEAAEAGGRTLVSSQNSFGRTALHIAVLAQNEEIVAYLVQNYPELLRIGDNLERTALHYAMGVQKIESLSRVLIRAGAKRVLKDLKGRQPSYYFMNKSDILRLQEEEEIY